MKQKQFLVLLFALLVSTCTIANNIQIANVSLTGQNTTNKTVQVQFTISWENSWRVSAGPANWDAAWIFIKYRIGGGPWLHATLNAAGHVQPAGSTITTGLVTPGTAFNAVTNPGVGAFIYRSANGSGTFTATDAQLQWNYGANGLGNNDVADIQVFGIEQVYVPQGSFAVGDGLSDASQFTITTINTANATTAPAGSGTLGGQAGGYPTGQTAPADATWPNGFNAFYCMKYEITQQGYVDFLNTLSRSQQISRVGTDISVGVVVVSNFYVMTNAATPVRNGIRCNLVIQANSPVNFYCDLDADGIGGEINDGQNIACGWMTPVDVAAYLDWSGLRPITELEYEKSGRGTLLPLAGEYAWGTTILKIAVDQVDAGKPTEKQTPGANLNGTVARVGSIAGEATNREQAGAGYYGNMELAGNVNERAITLANAPGRSFLGTHGNGTLNQAGVYTNVDWPLSGTGTGFGLRGGGNTAISPQELRLSDRAATQNGSLTRNNYYGGRGGRTAL